MSLKLVPGPDGKPRLPVGTIYIDEPEYCEECGFILAATTHGKGYRQCGPCGAKCCDYGCLASHKQDCHAVRERTARRAAGRR